MKAIKGPQPWTSIMPTGGVSPTEESLKAWFEAGVTCVGMGSKLIAKDTSGHYNFKEIEKMIKFSIDTIKSYK